MADIREESIFAFNIFFQGSQFNFPALGCNFNLVNSFLFFMPFAELYQGSS